MPPTQGELLWQFLEHFRANAAESDQRLLLDRWISDNTWAATMNGYIEAVNPSCRDVGDCSGSTFNNLLARCKSVKHSFQDYADTSPTHFCREKLGKQYYYYLASTSNGFPYGFRMPMKDGTWLQEIVEHEGRLAKQRKTRVYNSTITPVVVPRHSQRSVELPFQTGGAPETSSPDRVDRQHELATNNTTDNIDIDSNAIDNLATLPIDNPPMPETRNNQSTINNEQFFSYWWSKEAEKTFGMKSGDESAKVTVERYITELQYAQKHHTGWRFIVDDHDKKKVMTEHQIFALRQQCQLLCLAYRNALKYMNGGKTWLWCCKEACRVLNATGNVRIISGKRLSEKNIEFRQKECFRNPHPFSRTDKRPEPMLCQVFPDFTRKLKLFCNSILATMTLENVHEHIHENMLPEMLEEWRQNPDVDDGATMEDFLRAHRLKNLSLNTVNNWLLMIGYSYSAKRKSYYVDGHEREDVVAYRNQFVKRYLTLYEPRCLRWKQFREEERCDKLKKRVGYRYADSEGNKMVEYHIDDVADIESEQVSSAPRTMSVRAPEGSKPLVIIGQDEALFGQYLLGQKFWSGPNGETPLLPKSEGDQYMMSAMVSRDLIGFARELTEEELQRVNIHRNGKEYRDREAAMEVHNSATKKDLTSSPFRRFVLIGVNNDGYWNSNHMAIQLEDCVDCLQALYGDQFDFLFLFDHSQGHDRKRDGALDVRDMNKSFGGSSKGKLRDSNLTEGCIGPHLHDKVLSVNNTQSMCFGPNDEGPFWMTPEEREQKRHQRETNKRRKRKKTIAELQKDIKDRGGTIVEGRKYKLVELREVARATGIDLETEEMVVEQGWEGQAKGMLQVLWETGWIDPCKVASYTLKGRKDKETATIDEEFSLQRILSERPDFVNEKTALQSLGEELGVVVDRSPKFHAELAGEGIEYCWGFAKLRYRQIPYQKKRGRKNFIELVVKVTANNDEFFNQRRVESFARRARSYMCAYYCLSQQQQQVQESTNEHSPQHQQAWFQDIERLMKSFKTHRSALDFDKAFLVGSLHVTDEEHR